MLALTRTAEQLTGVGLPGSGSNSWVVAGARTSTGSPILSNDPHLGAQLPSVWYLAHLTGGDLDVIGATLPGVPGVAIGHNRRIAWGMTNLMADVQDLFVERLRGDNAVEYDGRAEPLRVLHETIRVKDAADVTVEVRISRHGPLVSDVFDADEEALALRWTALDEADGSVEGFLGVMRADDWPGFVRAASRIHSAVQNIVYADVDGNIGHYAPGAVPVRARGDGRRPVPGWTSEHEWTGYVPFESLPHRFNPSAGLIVTANNKAVADTFPYHLSTNWEPPWRAERILERIESSAVLSGDAMASIQADVRSGHARAMLPALVAAPVRSDASRAAIDLLRHWDGRMAPDNAAAAVFQAWYPELRTATLGDDIGDGLLDDYFHDGREAALALHGILGAPERGRHAEAWCDDSRTTAMERCADVLATSLARALASSTRRHGNSDPRAWRYDTTNQLTFPHLPLEAVAGLRWIFSRRLPVGGDRFTVNPTMRIADRTVVSSYRQIIELGDLDRSRFMLTVGQSGQPASPQYDDMLDRWQRVAYIPMRFTRAAVDRATATRLVLQPHASQP